MKPETRERVLAQKRANPRNLEVKRLFEEEKMTMSDIGALMLISRERVRQILTLYGLTDKTRRSERNERIAELAMSGKFAPLVAEEAGVSVHTVREVARAKGIKIPRDPEVGRTVDVNLATHWRDMKRYLWYRSRADAIRTKGRREYPNSAREWPKAERCEARDGGTRPDYCRHIQNGEVPCPASMVANSIRTSNIRYETIFGPLDF